MSKNPDKSKIITPEIDLPAASEDVMDASLFPYTPGAIVRYVAPYTSKQTCGSIGVPSSRPVMVVGGMRCGPTSRVQCMILTSQTESYYGYRIFMNSIERGMQKFSIVCPQEVYPIQIKYLHEIYGFAHPLFVRKCLDAYMFELGLSDKVPEYYTGDDHIMRWLNMGNANVPAAPKNFNVPSEDVEVHKEQNQVASYMRSTSVPRNLYTQHPQITMFQETDDEPIPTEVVVEEPVQIEVSETISNNESADDTESNTTASDDEAVDKTFSSSKLQVIVTRENVSNFVDAYIEQTPCKMIEAVALFKVFVLATYGDAASYTRTSRRFVDIMYDLLPKIHRTTAGEPKHNYYSGIGFNVAKLEAAGLSEYAKYSIENNDPDTAFGDEAPYTTKDASKLLKLDTINIISLIRSGVLEGKRLGRNYYTCASAIQKYLNSQSNPSDIESTVVKRIEEIANRIPTKQPTKESLTKRIHGCEKPLLTADTMKLIEAGDIRQPKMSDGVRMTLKTIYENMSPNLKWEIWMRRYNATELLNLGIASSMYYTKPLIGYVVNRVNSMKRNLIKDMNQRRINPECLGSAYETAFRALFPKEIRQCNINIARYEECLNILGIPYSNTYIGALMDSNLFSQEMLVL